MRKSLIFNVLASFVCFVGFSKAVAQPACHLSLSGRAVEAETNEPLPFATVSLIGADRGAVTDERGHFELKNLCPGHFTVAISHLECAHAEQFIELSEANEGSVFEFRLHHRAVELGTATVKAIALAARLVQPSSRTEATDFAAAQAKSLGDALRNVAGVALLSTGSTIQKPIIGGLHSSRVAIVQGGAVIESQQWGSEHAPEIDPFAATSATVVKGAAGVRYGPGAMGGAVIVEPAPLRDSAGLGGWAAMGFFSNGRAGSAAAALDFRSKSRAWPLAGRFQTTVKRSGNHRAPDYFLGNTGGGELNFSALMRLSRPRWAWELAASRFSQKIGILKAAHIGNLSDLKRAIEADEPLQNDDFFTYEIASPRQQVEHDLAKLRASRSLGERWRLSLQHVWQYDRRAEFDRKSSPTAKPNVRFDLFTNSTEAIFAHSPVRHWSGELGAQAVVQQNIVQRSALIPDFLSLGGAFFAIERWRRADKPFEIEAGLRADLKSQSVERFKFQDTLRERLFFKTLSATLGGVFFPSKNWECTAQTGLAGRPPHVSELFAEGVHHGAATFEQGRSDLRTEQAWNSQLGLKWSKKGLFRLETSFFINRIWRYIYLRPEQELVLTVRGAFPKYSYQQADAMLRGGDAMASIGLSKNLVFETKSSIVRGFLIGSTAGEGRDWLPLMPADRWQNSLRWAFFDRQKQREIGFLRLRASTLFKQTRYRADQLLKPMPEGATLIGLDGGATLSIGRRRLELGFSSENLLNARYRDATDFFRFFADAPGRDGGLRAKLLF